MNARRARRIRRLALVMSEDGPTQGFTVKSIYRHLKRMWSRGNRRAISAMLRRVK
jgi:hypothetical protein